MNDKRENTGRKQDGRWQAGVSGNPAGKPRGARHQATRAAEALLEGEAEGLARMAVEAALSGDVQALRLCLDRILPPRKGRPVTFKLEVAGTAVDLKVASLRVLEAVAAGELTPDEGQAVSAIVEQARRTLETVELAKRLENLEAKL